MNKEFDRNFEKATKGDYSWADLIDHSVNLDELHKIQHHLEVMDADNRNRVNNNGKLNDRYSPLMTDYMLTRCKERIEQVKLKVDKLHDFAEEQLRFTEETLKSAKTDYDVGNFEGRIDLLKEFLKIIEE